MYLWTVLLLMGLHGALSAQTFVLPARSADRATTIASQFDYLEDPTLALTIEQVRGTEWSEKFATAEKIKGAINFGLTDSAYWLRLSIQNGKDTDIQQMLEVTYPRLYNLDFYRLQRDAVVQTVHTGYSRPFAQRAYPNRNFVFPMLIPPGESVIYLRVESRSSLEVPVSLWSAAGFQKHERADNVMQAAYFGMAAAMLLFNLLLFLSLRSTGYLYYLFFVVSITTVQLVTTGIGSAYLWDEFPSWTTISFGVSGHFTAIWLLLFMRHMLSTPVTAKPWVEKVIWGVIVANMVDILVSLIDYQVRLAMFVLFCSACTVLGVSVMGAIKGQRSAKIFLSAFLVVILSVMGVVMRLAGVLPSNAWTVNGVQVGSAIEMVLLAFALADRFHVLRAEKEKAQADVLESERRVIETLRTSERVLEARVLERTAELSATVAQLQQSQLDLIEAEKLASLGSLVAGIAHELNTPIGNALVTATAMDSDSRELVQHVAAGTMKRSSLDAFLRRSTEMSELLVRSCQRAAHLIASFKKVAVDQTSEQQRRFDVQELVADIIATLSPGLKKSALTLENKVPSSIVCDSYPGPLGQVLGNLVQNAVLHAFGPEASGVLTIEGQVNQTHVTLIITDNGKGMTPDVLKRAFDPFFTTRMGQGGSGLGLAICATLSLACWVAPFNCSPPQDSARFLRLSFLWWPRTCRPARP